ncbi:MAG: hypothetical protein E7058_10465 [Lentisphaerae bacterium]|nr:hypothetical protein [Lentisphaerota bacterium]
MKKLTAAAVLAAAVSSGAAENLLMNGSLQSNLGKFPPYWAYVNSTGGKYEYHTSGGPGNRPFIRLISRGDTLALKQNNLTLVRGEKYRLSAYFRTRNLANKESGISVGTGPWAKFNKTNSLFGLPRNLSQWRKIEKIITIDPAVEDENYKFYTVDIAVKRGGGEMDIADIRLEAISEKAKRYSKSAMDTFEPHLVPVCALSELPQSKPVLEFAWVGTFPGDPDGTDVEISFDVNGKRKRIPFQFGRFSVDVSGVIPDGESRMTVKLVSRASGKVIQEESFSVRTIVIPEVKNARQLNNLTTELCAMDLKSGQEFAAANPRYGFVLIRFKPAKAGKFAVTLDGKELFDETFPRNEVIRQLDAGVYKIKADTDGKLIVRLIPDVVNFGGPSHAYAPGNGYYNWTFHKKYVNGGVTTFTAGRFSDAQYAEMRKHGMILLEDQGILNLKANNSHESIFSLLDKSRIPGKRNSGMTLDEAECFYPPLLDPLAYALKKYTNPTGKAIVTYMTGPITPAALNFIGTCANASGKQGYLAIEYYLRSQKNEEEARATVAQLAQHQWIFKEVAPALYHKAGILLGNFSLYPRITLAHYPYQDYKVFLDMQMNAVANDPAFEGAGKVGFWGSYACDEELLRWSFALMRHYVFEGNKGMLSEKYGFKLTPGHLVNSDFADGLNGWKVSGDVTLDDYPGYGTNSLRLWASSSATGDKFAVFTKHEGKVNKLSQTAKGLEKGKTYTLYFYTADLDTIIADRPEVRRIPIAVSLSNAEILQRTHFNGNPRTTPGPICNTEKIIFRALDDEVTLTFSDAKAAAGEMNVLNYIALRPYFEKEEQK